MSAVDERRSPRPPIPEPARGSALTTRLAGLAGLCGCALQLGVFAIAAHSAPDMSAQRLSGAIDGAVVAAVHQNTHTLLICLPLQAVAALLISLAIARMMPARYRLPRAGLLSALWFLNFAVPVGGVVCTIGALAVAATRFPARQRQTTGHTR